MTNWELAALEKLLMAKIFHLSDYIEDLNLLGPLNSTVDPSIPYCQRDLDKLSSESIQDRLIRQLWYSDHLVETLLLNEEASHGTNTEA